MSQDRLSGGDDNDDDVYDNNDLTIRILSCYETLLMVVLIMPEMILQGHKIVQNNDKYLLRQAVRTCCGIVCL